MKIAFVHPDLGIGGAERLVIDAAVGLKNLGHEIVIYTSYRDENHCFDEARDGTLEVRVRGDTVIPANIAGRFSILCAMLRQVHLAITLLRDPDQYDAIFIDQLSVAIPLIKFYREQLRILFYCHFPDKLLSERQNSLKKLYRVPFDFIEGWTTGQADSIVVNSRFTASVFNQAFPSIKQNPQVIYPCVDIHQSFSKAAVITKRKIVLSINRFERKKNLGLALQAFAKLKSHECFNDAVLVIAGGHDTRVAENVSYHNLLVEQCTELNLSHKTLRPPFELPLRIEADVNVYFLLSIPSELKAGLLSTSSLLAYTPEREHFGIVPIEASLAELPVVAQNNGGPLETIDDAITGYLRPADPALWAEIFNKILFELSTVDRKEMGTQGRKKVLTQFSQETMAKNLDEEFEKMKKRPNAIISHGAMLLLAVFMITMWRLALRPLVLAAYERFGR